ncbi:MAG: D-tyrosyl-tRNA(Tyr) deacylase, partial [Gammaproteobacteria bacterium]|nr:D-tyrosyl-tRNA(Tyr) deacylase [Gammaproteobacteria bacterium]
MIALIQRVAHAQVEVGGERVAQIGAGLLALIGIERGDAAANAERLLGRVLAYRVFADAAGRMNLSVREVGGDVLLVPQFTLAADTDQGTRAGFSRAAAPREAQVLFEQLVKSAHA